jgi:hypothetical protein
MCRSLTYAQRAGRVLERSGIFGAVVKAPQHLTESGCGYGVKVKARDLELAVQTIKSAGITTGKIIGIDKTGSAAVV